jgi:hypothetical protein
LTCSVDGLPSVIAALLDVLSLKCPSCGATVDPFPDACSAILCLSCGHHYCNFCFAAFNGPVSESNKADAHRHVACHSPERDPFLSVDVVSRGHLLHRERQVVLVLSAEVRATGRGKQLAALALVLAADELRDVGLAVSELWSAATLGTRTNASTSIEQPPRASPADYGQLLANALKTGNLEAAMQVLSVLPPTALDFEVQSVSQSTLARITATTRTRSSGTHSARWQCCAG